MMKHTFPIALALTLGLGGCSSDDDETAPIPPPNNTPPIAESDSVTVYRGETVEIDVLANDSDPDGDAIHIVESQLTITEAGLISYSAAADAPLGQKVFSYTISDGELEDSAPIYITVKAKTEVPSEATFVTADTCKSCHSGHYEQWQDTKHAHDYRRLYTEENKTIEAIIPELDWGTEANPQRHTIWGMPYQFSTYKTEDGKYYAQLHDGVDPTKSVTYRIDGISSTTSKQFVSYDFPSDDDPNVESSYGRMMPFAWFNDGNVQRFTGFYTTGAFWHKDGSLVQEGDIINSAFVGPIDQREELKKMSWDNQCLTCHVTGGKVLEWDESELYGMLAGHTNSKDSEAVEDGISCERCHNEGSLHASSMSGDDIANPGKMTFQQSVDSCAQCHQMFKHPDIYHYSQPYIPALDDEGNITTGQGQHYRVGDELTQFTEFDPQGMFLGTTFRKGQKNQVHDYMSSSHYEAQIDCVTCHEPHTMGMQREGDALCTECHADKGSNHTLAIHDMVGATCIDCHFVATESVATRWSNDNHTFKAISPVESLANFDALAPYARGEGTNPQMTKLWGMLQQMGGANGVCYSNGIYRNSSYVCDSFDVLPNACSNCHSSEHPQPGVFDDTERAKLIQATERYQRFLDQQQ